MERYLNSIDCPLLFASLGSWEDTWVVFQQAILNRIDILMPAKKVRVFSTDSPWMTPRHKNLIRKMSKCLHQLLYEFYTVFKHSKILVNRERKTCGERYYESSIQHLKDEHPKRWWDEMQRLSGAN